MVEHLISVIQYSESLDEIRMAIECLPKVYYD